jgi:GxxExxY protein
MNISQINRITGIIVDAAIKVHTVLGPGLLENTYKTCLAHELTRRGLKVAREVGLPVVYDGVKLELGYRLDIRCNNRSEGRRSAGADPRGSATLLPQT